MSVPGSSAEPTLRERKKLQAKRRIQAAAIDLLERRGYQSVTVEQIAEAADVSASSIYRYFETKEAVFLWDEYDETFIAEFGSKVGALPPLAALSQAVEALGGRFAGDEDRLLHHLKLIYSVPELERAMRGYVEALRTELVRMLADGSDRLPTDIRVQVVAAAVIGAFVAVVESWVADDGKSELSALIAEALETLEAGLAL